MPISLVLILALVALILLRHERKKSAAVFVVAAMAVLWLPTPIVPRACIAIRARYPARPLAEFRAGTVLLGGACRQPWRRGSTWS
jgi:peptidoglycan/LPS O-acetylase OafA/YrhL